MLKRNMTNFKSLEIIIKYFSYCDYLYVVTIIFTYHNLVWLTIDVFLM